MVDGQKLVTRNQDISVESAFMYWSTKGKTSIVIQTPSGESVTQTVPAGLTINVKTSDVVKADQALTLNPNVGGFGQAETEIILQSPNRVKGMIVFFFTVTVAQVLLVIKKKQFEKVQAAEMNF